jgi:hypothetical protein
MKACRILVIATLSLLLAPTVPAAPTTTIAETFDGTLADASWRAATADTIASTGGHPGPYLLSDPLDAAVPHLILQPALGPQFLGNYRFMGVSSAGLDVQLFRADFGADQRPVTLLLGSDMGTPDDPSDDCEAANISGKNVPRPGTGWKPFDFKVPSQSTTLPQGWQLVGTCAGLAPDAAWNAVIQNVQQVRFDFGEPDIAYFFQVWSIGWDNPRITLRDNGTGS